MPDTLPASRPPLTLPGRLLAAWPHAAAFWPDRAVMAGPDDTPLPFALGPFRPPVLAGREMPVAIVTGEAADPIGAALRRPAAIPADLPDLLARIVAGRIGSPPGLARPADLPGAWPDRPVIVLDPCDPARRAEAEARLARARQEAAGVLAVRDPFATGAAVLEGSLPPVEPWALLDAARELRGASRELALLALAAAVPLADGPLAEADRLQAWASLLAATRCADPFDRVPMDPVQAVALLALWRERAAGARGIAACLGIHPYKRPRLASLLASDSPPPSFHATAARALRAARRRRGALLVWSATAPPGLRDRATAAGVELRWIEDGFLRSAGLGAAFRPGASFAIDSRGPHFDPARESDLERLLNTVAFPPELLARARLLREAIVAGGITKYNVGGAVAPLAAPPGRRRILVPGQVEDDASVRRGGGAIRTNLALLQAVRAAEPDAFLVYKPHPDIEAGFRRGRIPARLLDRLADQVLEGAAIPAVLQQVDAVHTLTSQTGFEALLRGLPVTCWGLPFYAGWGLTSDRVQPPRPRRPLSLDELVAGTLILYPLYHDPVTELPCPPEILLRRITRPECFPTGRLGTLRALEGAVRRAWARLRRCA